MDILKIIFFVVALLAYCASLWYEFYKVVKNYKEKES